MTKCSFGVFTGLFVGVLLCNVSLAQMDAQKGEPFRFSLSIAGETTDNRDSSVNEVSNTDFFITPRVDVVSDTDRTILKFYYEPSYRYRTEPYISQTADEFQHDLGLKLAHEFNEAASGYINERYVLTDDPSATVANTTFRRNSSYYLNNVEAGGKLLMTELSYVGLDVSHLFRRYDEQVVARDADVDMLDGSLMFGRTMTEKVAVFLTAGASQVDYDKSEGIDRGFNALNGGAGISRDFTAQVQGSVRVGVRSLEYSDSSLSSDSAPFVQASLESSMSAQTVVSLVAKYGKRDADIYPFASQESSEFIAKIDWKGTEKLRFLFWGSYRLGTYDAETVPDSALRQAGVATPEALLAMYGWKANGDQTVIIAGISATFAMDDNTAITLGQTFEDVDSDVSTSFTRNATRLSLKRKF